MTVEAGVSRRWEVIERDGGRCNEPTGDHGDDALRREPYAASAIPKQQQPTAVSLQTPQAVTSTDRGACTSAERRRPPTGGGLRRLTSGRAREVACAPVIGAA